MESINIMKVKRKKGLDDIYRKHYVEIRMSKELSQQLIYMYIVYGESKRVEEFIDDIRMRRETDDVIYHLFTDKNLLKISDDLIHDGRISIIIMADKLSEIFPKSKQIIYLVLLGEEIAEALMDQKGDGYIKQYAPLLYRAIHSGGETTHNVLKYAKHLAHPLYSTPEYKFPCRLIPKYIKELSEIPRIETVLCECHYRSIFDCLIHSFYPSIKSAQYIPGSYLKKNIYALSSEYLLYSIDQGYINVNFLLEQHHLRVKIAQMPADIVKQLIDRGLCFYTSFKHFRSAQYYLETADCINYWALKRPQDLSMMIGSGFEVTESLIQKMRYSIDVSLFCIEPYIVHEMTFITNIKRIEEYLAAKETCTNGLILAIMYKCPKYYFGVIPTDIVKIIHSFLR